MEKNELKRLLKASLKPVAADPGALHTACLYLKDYADQLLAAQDLSVPQRLAYWQACFEVYNYLRLNKCLQRKKNPKQYLYSLDVYEAVDDAEHRLERKGGELWPN